MAEDKKKTAAKKPAAAKAKTDKPAAKKAPAKKSAAPKKEAAKKAPAAAKAKEAAPKKEAAKTAAPKKAPAKTAAPKKTSKDGKTLVVVQTGSPVGRHASQRKTLIGLGLNKMHKRRELEDTPAVRGMINKVKHLVKVEDAA